MKPLVSIAGVLCVLAVSVQAHAQPSGDSSRRNERYQQQREQRQDQTFHHRQRERGDGESRPGRLTPEERQQLRRDIREHGREVYRDRPPRN